MSSTETPDNRKIFVCVKCMAYFNSYSEAKLHDYNSGHTPQAFFLYSQYSPDWGERIARMSS